MHHSPPWPDPSSALEPIGGPGNPARPAIPALPSARWPTGRIQTGRSLGGRSLRGRKLAAWLAMGFTMASSGCDGCSGVKQGLVKHYPTGYEAEGDPKQLEPVFEGADQNRRHVAVRLRAVGTGFDQPTDLQAVPGQPDLLVVLEKGGSLKWLKPGDGSHGELMKLEVLTASEQGLLGLAFHPQFETNGRLYLNTSVARGGRELSRVAEWQVTPGIPLEESRPKNERIVLEVEQPYANHNGGQLAFGPDGMLYIGWGDGGWRDDPHRAGQDTTKLLGKMLRIDVDHPEAGRGYAIPPDNPFVGQVGHRGEIWALGLRNPWRYSFAPDGRLIVADVGQNTYEELSIVTRGGNYGWNRREGAHCFPPALEACDTTDLIDPIYEYGRAEGASITGGYVVTSAKVPELEGRYVFGDFVSGRIWAFSLPTGPGAPASVPGAEVLSLGRWPILISTFGRSLSGELYLADFGSGTVYRIEAHSSAGP